MVKPVVQVAIALLMHQQKILVGWREAKQHQGNKHEFPGGKVESQETPRQACSREIQEEVGITVLPESWQEFDVIKHEYEDIHVHLSFFIASVSADQMAIIQQPWVWYDRTVLPTLNFPKANQQIIERLVCWNQI